MANADTRTDRSTDYEASRPSVDAPITPHEWTEYRCRRCGEHCINRAEGEPSDEELCLDCLAMAAAESPLASEERSESDDAPPSPFRSVRSSLATVAARFGGD